MLGKLLIDNGKSPLNMAVGFLNTDIESVVGDGCSVGERHHPPVGKNAAASHFQRIPIGKNRLHHTLFGGNGSAVRLFLLTPQSRKAAALVEKFGCEPSVLKIGVLGAEAFDVVALGLVGSALKRGKAVAAVDIVVLVAARLGLNRELR